MAAGRQPSISKATKRNRGPIPCSQIIPRHRLRSRRHQSERQPAAVEDAEVAIAAFESGKQSLARERDLGPANEERIAEIAQRRERLNALEADWAKERALVEEILALREKIAKKVAEPSRAFLKRSLAREEIRETKVSAADGGFVYEVA